MNLRVLMLNFVDGITMLGGRQSIAAVHTPGVPTAKSITRAAGGYLVGWQEKLYFIPDSRVVCAQVEEVGAERTEPKPVAPASTIVPPSATGPVPADAVEVSPGIVQLPNGQMMRAGTTQALTPAPAGVDPEPAPAGDGPRDDAVPYKHTPKRRPPTRRSGRAAE